MAQDYAKQRTPDAQRRRPVRAATRTGAIQATTHWSWFFSGLMAGVIVSIAGYLGVLKLEADAAENAQIAQNSENPEEPPTFIYGFYDDLANAVVSVDTPPVAGAPVAAAAAQAAPVAAPSDSGEPATAGAATAADTTVATVPTASETSGSYYLLQAGSFQNRQDAENQRARIMLLNINANVVPGVVSGRTFHRVQVGPFADRRGTEEAREALSVNNIDSILLQIR